MPSCYLLIYSNIDVTCKNIIVKQSNIQIHDRAVLLNCVFSLGDTNNLNWLDIDMFSLLVLLQRPPWSQFFRTLVALKLPMKCWCVFHKSKLRFKGFLTLDTRQGCPGHLVHVGLVFKHSTFCFKSLRTEITKEGKGRLEVLMFSFDVIFQSCSRIVFFEARVAWKLLRHLSVVALVMSKEITRRNFLAANTTPNSEISSRIHQWAWLKRTYGISNGYWSMLQFVRVKVKSESEKCK